MDFTLPRDWPSIPITDAFDELPSSEFVGSCECREYGEFTPPYAREKERKRINSRSCPTNSRKSPNSSAHKLQTFQPDTCCGKLMGRAISSGELDSAESWTCPKCGCDWKPRQVGELRHWEPVEVVMVIRT